MEQNHVKSLEEQNTSNLKTDVRPTRKSFLDNLSRRQISLRPTKTLNKSKKLLKKEFNKRDSTSRLDSSFTLDEFLTQLPFIFVWFFLYFF